MQKLDILGFGNQAKSWALNLRDSGTLIRIVLRHNSPRLKQANSLNFEVISLDESIATDPTPLAMLIPDDQHHQLENFLLDHLHQFPELKKTLIYAHGHSLHQRFPHSQLNQLLLAPKAIASEMRFAYETKGKFGGVFSVERSHQPEHDKLLLLKLAHGLGFTAGPYEVSIKDETHADLFSEQGLLCSLIPYVANECYRLLRKNQVPTELAYMECWYEVKLIVDTLIKLGPEKFFQMISPNALYGSEKAKEKLFDQNFYRKLEEIYHDIESGRFDQWLEQINEDELKSKINDFWKHQELSRTHENLRAKFFQ